MGWDIERRKWHEVEDYVEEKWGSQKTLEEEKNSGVHIDIFGGNVTKVMINSH